MVAQMAIGASQNTAGTGADWLEISGECPDGLPRKGRRRAEVRLGGMAARDVLSSLLHQQVPLSIIHGF